MLYKNIYIKECVKKYNRVEKRKIIQLTKIFEYRLEKKVLSKKIKGYEKIPKIHFMNFQQLVVI